MYYLQPALLTPPPRLRIGKKEFEKLLDARKKLTAGFPVEENFDLLVCNYLELEKTAIFIATSDMVQSRASYQEFFEIRAELNRRAINFLTTARLYVDQIQKRIADCGQQKSVIRAALSERYDANFEYRFMEALRNHVQHNGSAVHSVTLGGKWLPGRPRERHEYSVIAYTVRQHLERDPSFKVSVLSECPERVDFLSASRVYVESIGQVQRIARQLIEPTMASARDAMDRAIARYKKYAKSESVGLAACFSVKDKIVEQVPVFTEWDDVRLKLEQRNGAMVNLSKRFVSSAQASTAA